MRNNGFLSAALAVTALVGVLVGAGTARAAFVLDTGAPAAGAAMPGVLDANDFSAAEFNLAAGATITGISAYVTQGFDQTGPGATFTLAIYAGADLTSRNSSPLFSTQATYSSDGWNGVSGLNFTPGAAGQYWAAVEVGSADSAMGLALPAPTAGAGTAPALAFAYNGGGGYTTGGNPIGIQVTATAPVPLPASLWLLGSGVIGLGSRVRRRRAVAIA